MFYNLHIPVSYNDMTKIQENLMELSFVFQDMLRDRQIMDYDAIGDKILNGNYSPTAYVHEKLCDLAQEFEDTWNEEEGNYLCDINEFARNRIVQIFSGEKENETEQWKQKLVEKCDEKLQLSGYKEYIASNLGKALEATSFHGCLHDVDNMVHLEKLLGIPVPYDLCDYINTRIDYSVQELSEKKLDFLRELTEDWLEGIREPIKEPEQDESELIPVKVPAELLPEGWMWEQYIDGSGHLVSPEGACYFGYDMLTKEYVDPLKEKWDDFPDYVSLDEFMKFAEKKILEYQKSGKLQPEGDMEKKLMQEAAELHDMWADAAIRLEEANEENKKLREEVQSLKGEK